jgi:hypothetical protein
MTGEFWRRLARNRLLDVATGVLVACVLVTVAQGLPARARQDDFSHYYLSSRLLLEGQNPYKVELIPLYASYGFILPPGIPTIRTPNPPLFVWLFTPFARLAPGPGFACWVFVEICCLVVILWQTRQLLGSRLTKRGWWFVCAAAVTSAPVYWHLHYSQMGLLLTALVLTGYRWHVQGKQTLACVTVTVAGLLKVFPLVLLPWFLWRSQGTLRQRTTRAAVAAGVAGILVLLTGVHRWLDFVRYIVPQVAGASLTPFNFSLPGFVANLGLALSGIDPTADTARPWITWGVYTGLFLIALGYLACWWKGADREAEFCLLCVVMLAGSMRTWGHYLVFLIFPVAVLAVRIARRPSWGGVALLVAILVFVNDMGTREGPAFDQHRLLKVFVNDFPLYGLLALAAFFWRELYRHRGTAPSAATE